MTLRTDRQLFSPRPPQVAQRGQIGQRGTTLVELMIGLMILSVLGGLALPGVSSLTRAYYLRTAADDVVYAASLARNQAAANRRAYGLFFEGLDGAGAGLKVRVHQGTDTSCASTAPGGGALQMYAADWTIGNALNNPPIAIVAYAPAEMTNSAVWVCFKPDGRVLRADLSLPFSPPAGSLFGAGDIVLELQRVESNGVVVGNRLQVQIGYNGTARITFGRDTSKLQGAAQ